VEQSREQYRKWVILAWLQEKGKTHRERSLKKVECNHCGCLVAEQYLPKHKMPPKCCKSKPIAHPAARDTEVEEALPLQEPAREYRVSISSPGGMQCPVENCGCRATANNSMGVRFRNKHQHGLSTQIAMGIFTFVTYK
jgi:hypothetical protein